MWKLRAGASSAQFRDSGPEASVNPFAEDEHWRHPNSATLEIGPSSAWKRWGFTTCIHTGKPPGSRKLANPPRQAPLCWSKGTLWRLLELRRSWRTRCPGKSLVSHQRFYMWCSAIGCSTSKATNIVELSPVKVALVLAFTVSFLSSSTMYSQRTLLTLRSRRGKPVACSYRDYEVGDVELTF